jgi:hypothetical protein
MNDQSLETIFKVLISECEKDIESYQEATHRQLPFRTQLRLSMEESFRTCEILQDFFPEDLKDEFDFLIDFKEDVSRGRNLLNILSELKSTQTDHTFNLGEITLNLSKGDYEIVSKKIASIIEKLSQNSSLLIEKDVSQNKDPSQTLQNLEERIKNLCFY